MIGRRWWKVSSLLVLMIVVGQSSIAADTATEEITADLETKAAAVNSYRADLSTTFEMMGQKMVMQGKFIFKKPNKSWTETITDMGTMKMEQVIISNGKTTWTYQPQMKMVHKMDLEKIVAETKEESGGQKTGDISKPFQGFQRESISYIGTEEIEGKKVCVFEGFPQEPEMQKMPFGLTKMQIWIGADDGLLRKTIMFNQEDKEIMSQSYTNIEVNIEVADSQFEFTPPEGVQVMDMTEGAISMMKGMKGEEK